MLAEGEALGAPKVQDEGPRFLERIALQTWYVRRTAGTV